MSSYSRACKLIRPTHSNRQIDDDSMYTRSRHGRHGPFGGPEGPGRGFGGPGRGFGGPFGGPPWGGPGGRGPGGPGGRHGGRRRRGDVRTALLLLLAEEPRNGYQLMQEIEERSGGRWRPSPGSVYPALSQLEDEGLVRWPSKVEPGRVFEITDAGREHLETRRPARPVGARGRDKRALAVLVAQPVRLDRSRAWQVARRVTSSRSRRRATCSPRPGAGSTGSLPRSLWTTPETAATAPARTRRLP